jgi:hypothetical protein
MCYRRSGSARALDLMVSASAGNRQQQGQRRRDREARDREDPAGEPQGVAGALVPERETTEIQDASETEHQE